MRGVAGGAFDFWGKSRPFSSPGALVRLRHTANGKRKVNGKTTATDLSRLHSGRMTGSGIATTKGRSTTSETTPMRKFGNSLLARRSRTGIGRYCQRSSRCTSLTSSRSSLLIPSPTSAGRTRGSVRTLGTFRSGISRSSASRSTAMRSSRAARSRPSTRRSFS